MAHREHAEAANLLGCVEDDWGESAGHLGVEANLDAGLNFVLALDQQVKQLLRVHCRLPVVGHQPDERRVPLVHNLGECRRARRHQHLPHPVLKLLQRLIVNPQKRLSGSLLGLLVLQVPDPILLREVLGRHPRLGHDANLETAHVEQQVRVIPRIHRHKAIVPLERGDGPGQAVLYVPENRAAEVDVVLHESHARVPRPALLVVVSDHVLVVGIGVLGEVPLDEVLRLFRREPEEHVDLVDVPAVQADGVPGLRADVAVGDELVGHLRGTGNLARAGQTENQQIQHESVVLGHKRRKLQAADEAVGVGVGHVLVRDDHVVLRRDVICDVVVDDEAEQAVEHGEVNLLEHLLEFGLEHDDALAVVGVPHVGEVVDTLAPLVHQQRRRLGVRGLDPVGEQMPLVGLVPYVLVKVGIRDLLQRFNLIHGYEVRVEVHELDANLLERPLREEVSLDPRQRLVRVIESLLNQTELLALRLVETRRDGVVLLEPLQRQDEKLPVVLVGQRGEGNRRELARLEPVHGGCVDGHSLLGCDVGAILQVVVLPLLLSLEPQSREPPQVLAAHGLVHGGAAANALAVVVRHVGPPVSLGLDVTEDHVLDGRGQPRDLPRYVGLPAPPRLRKMLQDGLRLVRLDALGHHVQDVVHHRRAELEVEVRLDPLLRHRLGHALAVAALKLSRE
mmetsp:Transcript_10204/g.41240  ORF Transcript_10204/g.41240 Transcript_10204/m.41240 type:complete len:678 (+) Transcript_10204:3871-5904(+)